MNDRRFPAEWEPQSFVQFTFPHPESDWAENYEAAARCFVEIIELTARFVRILVVCHDVNAVRARFPANDHFEIHFEEIRSNDSWARDHGPLTILQGDDPIHLDFDFNGWGDKYPSSLDNRITGKLKAQGVLQSSMQHLGFVLEGGAVESDGQGTLLATSACLFNENRNGNFSEEAIETILSAELGLKRIMWLENGFLLGDDTDSHIDTLARFCNLETIAYVKCDDPEDEHYEELLRMERELKAFRTAQDRPYKLVALPWPEPCFDAKSNRLPVTYANFLITNGAVIVPTYGLPQDVIAIQTLKDCFPEREVLGVNCRPLIEQHGSLHCVTMQYPAEVKTSFL